MTEPVSPSPQAPQPSPQAPHASQPAPAADFGLPLFDERYRWVLLHALRWLRNDPAVNLDDPEQFEAAYGFLSDFVQRSAQRRGLTAKLDAVRVAAIVDSDAARSTVREILVSWLGAK